MDGVGLIGREREMSIVHDVIESVKVGGGALVVTGEQAGIGKSSLLSTARGDAADQGILILSTSGLQSETHLPFAGLHIPADRRTGYGTNLPGHHRLPGLRGQRLS